jgi:hypothetical protein
MLVLNFGHLQWATNKNRTEWKKLVFWRQLLILKRYSTIDSTNRFVSKSYIFTTFWNFWRFGYQKSACQKRPEKSARIFGTPNWSKRQKFQKVVKICEKVGLFEANGAKQVFHTVQFLLYQERSGLWKAGQFLLIAKNFWQKWGLPSASDSTSRVTRTTCSFERCAQKKENTRVKRLLRFRFPLVWPWRMVKCGK